MVCFEVNHCVLFVVSLNLFHVKSFGVLFHVTVLLLRMILFLDHEDFLMVIYITMHIIRSDIY